MPADRPDAETLAALRQRYAKPTTPRCAKCRGMMVWDNVWTPRHAPKMVIYVCRYCHQSEHVADGDPSVIRLLDAYEAERERAHRAEELAQLLGLELDQTRREYVAVRDSQRGAIVRLEAERDTLRAEASRLREAVDQLARLAGPGYTTAEALGIVERLRATEGTDGG